MKGKWLQALIVSGTLGLIGFAVLALLGFIDHYNLWRKIALATVLTALNMLWVILLLLLASKFNVDFTKVATKQKTDV